MTWPFALLANRMRRLDMGIRGRVETDLPKLVSGPALNTVTPQNSAARLLSERQALIAKRDKLHRNDPARAKLDREIYSVNHERMRVGG